jgi:prepilin-type N-terminal cleavage/methylation domain-containing protein
MASTGDSPADAMTRPSVSSQSGFTLVEVLAVLGIIAVLLATAMMVLPSAITFAKADSGSSQAVSVLRTCREMAITERRNVEITFEGTDRLVCRRREIAASGIPSGVLTDVRDVPIGERMEFQRFPGTPDTPDGFAAGATAVDFTGADPWSFTSEGTLVDANGDVVNGTVFLGQPQAPETARAVTLFGATAFLREWRWNGRGWTE